MTSPTAARPTAERLARRRPSPAQRQVTRIRWRTTAVFALTTALCLTVLSVLALRVDTASRADALTTALRTEAAALSDVIAPNAFTSAESLASLDLSRLDTIPTDRTVTVVGVLTPEAILYASPTQSSLPADAELRRRLHEQQADPEVRDSFAPDATGRELHWATAPVLAFSPSGRSVVGIVLDGGPLPGAAQHAELRSRLIAISAALLVLAALAGHVIAGFATRPARRALQSLERFQIEASHELRTPLSRLRLMVDNAEEAATAVERSAALDRAKDEVDELASLTTALLMRARSAPDGATAVREPLRLDQLVAVAVEESPGAQDVAVDAVPVVIEGAPEVLTQAVRNLVENALRHGLPPVRVRVDEHGIEVTDAGPGVRWRDRRRVLRPGETAGGGTGSGLALVVWAARLHGGDVRLDEAPGGGLRVRLRLAGRPAGRG
ncbi:HAMP domain-containing sensor histidine kinase [Pengzhenrongella sp.]|uniref:sensor histidine kinase n=1 Tax=Pengzhenrongella sp. TaxID=2888820 RepID=UPI002F950C5A